MEPILKQAAKDVAAQVRKGELLKLRKAADDIDLSAFDAIIEMAPRIIEPVGVDASIRTVKQLGLFDNDQLVDQVSQRAVDYARERAAELVGKRVLADGTVVDNPRAEWRIDTTTRDEVRRIISQGLEDNIGHDDIADQIEASFTFSPERAEIIANTEIAMANSQATLDSYHEARDVAGVKVKKEWQADEDPCEDCIANMDAGAIELEDEFPSGDDAPPAHPNCECVLLPVVDDEDA